MRNRRERTCSSLILYVHLITPVYQKQASQTPSAGECGKFLDIQSGHPLWNGVQGTTNLQKKSIPWTQEEQEWGAGDGLPASSCCSAAYTVTMIWSRGFRFRSGTMASLLGYPTGSSTNSFSFVGRCRSTLRRGPQLRGVVVTVTSPAF